MFKIVNNERLSDNMFRVTFEAPLVARKAQPGQFLMFRVDEFGERMPITISSYDREAGTVSVIMQRVGPARQQEGRRLCGRRCRPARQPRRV